MHNRAAHARKRLPIADIVAAFTPSRRFGTPFRPLKNGSGRERVADPTNQPRGQPPQATAQTPRLLWRRGDARGTRRFRGVLAKRAVVDPKGEPAHLGAGPAISPSADLETEDGVRGRAPERQPVRAQSRGGKFADEWRPVAHMKPHSGTGMEGRQFEYADCL